MHVCREDDVCSCWAWALEPDEKCPVHSGYRAWPPRCADCGRFIDPRRNDEPIEEPRND